mgnify:CR=1 FL=1
MTPIQRLHCSITSASTKYVEIYKKIGITSSLAVTSHLKPIKWNNKERFAMIIRVHLLIQIQFSRTLSWCTVSSYNSKIIKNSIRKYYNVLKPEKDKFPQSYMTHRIGLRFFEMNFIIFKLRKIITLVGRGYQICGNYSITLI